MGVAMVVVVVVFIFANQKGRSKKTPSDPVAESLEGGEKLVEAENSEKVGEKPFASDQKQSSEAQALQNSQKPQKSLVIEQPNSVRPQVGNGASKVDLVKKGEEWQMLFNGKPIFVKGLGGNRNLGMAASLGANSIRTWGDLDGYKKTLDGAKKHGLTVAMGLWMPHKRHGSQYHNPAWVKNLENKLLAYVRQFKDHPAVLCWGIGNEVELGAEHDPNMWKAINSLAKKVKQIDPNHPTMIVLAEVNHHKVNNIKRYCPDIDLVGLNAYDGAHSVVKRYLDCGLDKPCLVTEYGPRLHSKDNLGTVQEQTSSEKAKVYTEIYTSAVLAHPGKCLGGYAFMWGNKAERTDTYFGLLLGSGEVVAHGQHFYKLFGGKKPKNLAPQIQPLQTSPASRVSADGKPIKVKVVASDPDDDKLRYEWVLKSELGGTMGGDFIRSHQAIKNGIKVDPNDPTVVYVYHKVGKYRLYCYVKDGKGNAATASVSVMIKPKSNLVKAAKVKLPFALYQEREGETHYRAHGYMGGQAQHINMNFSYNGNPKSGKHCLRIKSPAHAWSGVRWQHPHGDWGDRAGGFDLTGAKALTFWARGEKGGESIVFGIGGITQDKKYYDTTHQEDKVTLTKEWKKYSIALKGDLSRIKTPLQWSTTTGGGDVVFFLDDVVIE